MNRWLLSLVLALGAVGAGTGTAAAEADAGPRRARVAQAPPDAVSIASADVTRAERARAALATQHATLDGTYDAQKNEIDKLKRQKASWRRDRALRSKLAESMETAQALGRIARELATADAELSRVRARGVAANDVALTSATGTRRTELTARRRQWAPAAPARRIVIPDDSLDPLADPEELDDRAAELIDSEGELAREIARLDGKAARFDRQADLRRQHARAEELVIRDDNDPRPGVAGPAGGASFTDGEAAPANPDEGPAGDGGFDRDVTTLAAVVDAGTVDVLRSAGRSNDPARQAAATRTARDAVAARLARLKQQRATIEARARDLRRAP